jgi:hypothetical protein
VAFAAPAAAQLELAPAPREIDGLTATPMDITRMEVSIVFDIEKQEARAVADMWFTTGAAGTPVFDLRQPITSAMLDGKEIDPAKMKAHDFGKATGTMRILEVEMEAGSEHHLHLEYTLQKPASPSAQEIGWLDGGVHWDTFFSDLNQGRYMEMWFPANLLHDQHPVTMNLKLVGASKEHQIVTNGTVEELGEADWKLTFPATYSAFSHMVVIIPSELVERSQAKAKVDGGIIHLDVTRLKTADQSLKEIHLATAKALQDFTGSMGPWAHGDRCTVFVWNGGRSMEYDGATTTSMGALRHELFHSWFGRGAKPSDQNAGWWDEAWNVYFCDGFRPEGAPVRKKDAPVTLATPNPWNRTTPGASYRKGAFFFGRLADVMGQDELIAAMSAFFKAHSPNPVSTEQMVDHLAAAAGEKSTQVRALFDRYVYGKDV